MSGSHTISATKTPCLDFRVFGVDICTGQSGEAAEPAASFDFCFLDFLDVGVDLVSFLTKASLLDLLTGGTAGSSSLSSPIMMTASSTGGRGAAATAGEVVTASFSSLAFFLPFLAGFFLGTLFS